MRKFAQSGIVFRSLLALFLMGSLDTMAQEYTLQVEVQVPPNTPLEDTLILVGEDQLMGNWFYPDAPEMQRKDDSTWFYRQKFPAHTPVNFKITRGGYFTEAMYYGERTAPVLPFTLEKDTTLVLKPKNWNDLYHRSMKGSVRYHHDFSDPQLKHTRDVIVWLPPSYFAEPQRKFPVVYAMDGQNLMDQSTSYGREWRMDEIADSLMRLGELREFIIVGVSNTALRWVEYSGTPEGKKYMAFLAGNLKPFIDTHYRTLDDSAHTAIIGSSMGGLIAFYMVWEYPEVFSGAACLSSGFAFDDGDIHAQVQASSASYPGTRIYMDCGDQNLDRHFLPANEKMHALLKTKHPEIDLDYRVFPGADHNEQAWSKRLEVPFKFLFPGKQNEKK